MAQPLGQGIGEGGYVNGAAGDPLVEHQLGVGDLPGGLGLRVGALLHRPGYRVRRAGDGHGDGVAVAVHHGGEIPPAPGEKAAGLVGQSGVHCGGGVHGDRGIVTVHRIALARTGEFGPAVRQQAGQGALQGGGSPFPGLAAHVHPGNGGVGQESTAARIGAKPHISTRQCQDQNEDNGQSDFSAPGHARSPCDPLSILIFHLHQLQNITEDVKYDYYYRTSSREKQLQNGYIALPAESALHAPDFAV